MATLYKTDGTREDVTPANGTDFKYDELKNFVEGYIEIVSLGKKKVMVVNEEGKLMNLPVNAEATKVMLEMLPMSRDYIVGNALVCKTSEIK